ncbi:MAG TPA: helix-turn-helix transcriptional regulator [Thermoanaerobaculia bacterium]|nr:helix-turn-helix transcriptional regulator [Thermoanaerobaculia bacterium]
MSEFSLETPEQVSGTLAARVKELRLARGWKQSTLAQRSGVSLASLRRFEESGKVSLQNLLDLAFALNRLGDFDALFQGLRASSIAELEADEKRSPRKRGRI